MDDYIKREDAIKWDSVNKDRREYGTFNLDDAYEAGYKDKIKQIEQIPAANVRENVRGEWIVEILTERFLTCPFCHETYKRRGLFNFCPNCGADMRGGENDG